MKAYICVSYNKKKEFKEVLDSIKQTLQSFGITAFIFADEYNFLPSQEKEMMTMALRHINDCNFLIAETSDKAIGIGIEAGYAKAKGKTVIYLRQKKAAHSTTVYGISDYAVIYVNTKDLATQLHELIQKIIPVL